MIMRFTLLTIWIGCVLLSYGYIVSAISSRSPKIDMKIVRFASVIMSIFFMPLAMYLIYKRDQDLIGHGWRW